MNFKWLLGAVMALFVGILVVAYVAARHANPVMLDLQGRPVEASR